MFEQINATSDILHEALNGLSARQRITADNLANADTPNFRGREVVFEAQLQQKIKQRKAEQAERMQISFEGAYTHPEHMPLNLPDDQPMAVYTVKGQMRNDGNGVDLEQENTRLAQAQIAYQAVTQVLSGRYSQLKYVISEGAR